jgi:hypothetical protein
VRCPLSLQIALADKFLGESVLPHADLTLTVVRKCLQPDAGSLVDAGVLDKCVAALAVTTDWGSISPRSPLLSLPPPVVADVVCAARDLGVCDRARLSDIALSFLNAVVARLDSAGAPTTAATAAAGDSSSDSGVGYAVSNGQLVPDAADADVSGGGDAAVSPEVLDACVGKLLRVLNVGAISTVEARLLLLGLLRGAARHQRVSEAAAWLHHMTGVAPLPAALCDSDSKEGGADDDAAVAAGATATAVAASSDSGAAADVEPPAAVTVCDSVQLVVLALGSRMSELVDVDLSWVPAPLLAAVVRQCSAADIVRLHVLETYLSVRTDGLALPPDPSMPVVPPTLPPLSAADVHAVLCASPHVSSRQRSTASAAASGGAGGGGGHSGGDVSDDGHLLDSDAWNSFVCAAFAATVWVFGERRMSLASRGALLRTLNDTGVLPLRTLPASTLRVAIASGSMPVDALWLAALDKCDALERRVSWLRGCEAAAARDAAKQRVCRSVHLPIGTRVVVKRSSGAYAEGVVRAYSASTRMHSVEYGRGDKRWYNMEKTVYQVVSVGTADDDDDDDGSSGSSDSSDSDTDDDRRE